MQYASHMSPIGKYYGLHATMDVYGHKLKPGQLSATLLWISNSGDGDVSSLNSIDVGWHVSRILLISNMIVYNL
jgi:hypothetical protein